MISPKIARLQFFLVPFLVPSSWAFQASPSRRSASALGVHQLRDADFMEMLLGGERYEMVPLPDSMVDTTLFVGNLNEFTRDEDLSDFFRSVTALQCVPACVVRRVNMVSLEYGFVTFPTVEQKEAAILRFHGSSFMGRDLKVEPIRDHPKKGRVRVPERMVSYVSGAAKTTRDGRVNTMRRISGSEEKTNVKQPNKKKATTRNKKNKKQPQFKLTELEQEELQRASRRGYVTLDGTGYRRGRKTSSLACAHRQFCDEREKPQIVLCKASGGRPLDCVIVDLSPLRMTNAVDDVLVKWKAQIITAATNEDMELRSDYLEDNCEALLTFEDEGRDLLTLEEEPLHAITLTDEDSWATEPISTLPVLSMGVFEGERSKAKAMARELALLWGIPEELAAANDSRSSSNSKGRKQKHSKKDENRRRRSNGKELDFFF